MLERTGFGNMLNGADGTGLRGGCCQTYSEAGCECLCALIGRIPTGKVVSQPTSAEAGNAVLGPAASWYKPARQTNGR